uniref:Pentatricopeptide repeat-containing protein n=1 Tax=Ananas comosus var. bracteatus TaxID=296719 RepID=A0A6V7PQ70_ANACO|nr:unnamed protein product [Ananas comosus var. bracteatus]
MIRLMSVQMMSLFSHPKSNSQMIALIVRNPELFEGFFRAVLRDFTDFEVDVEQISRILNSNFSSPKTVLIAIDDGCSIRISKPLVDKILQRFYNDWVPAFGFFMWAVSLATTTKVMRRLASAGRWSEAINAFKGFEHFGVEKDTQAMDVLLDTFSKARRGSETMKEMRHSSFYPCVITYTSLLETYCLDKNFRMVDAVLDEMHAQAFCDHSQEENALKLLVKMEETSCHPDVKTYTPLLKLCCTKQWLKILYFLLGHMLRKDISPDFSTYTLLVNGLCRNGKLERSCLFFEQMVLRGLIPNDNTYIMLMGALERKNMDKAKRKIHQLMIKAETLKPPRQRAVADRNQTRQQSIGLS